MKHLILSVLLIIIGTFAISHGYALFTDKVAADDNMFFSGSFDIEMSAIDNDGDGTGDPDAWDWSYGAENVWTTPVQWLPGDTMSKMVFIRNSGEVDADSLLLTLSGRTYGPGKQLDDQINLIEAWYDRNADGVLDEGENILPELAAAYDTNGDKLTLLDLYTGVDVVHGGEMFELEPGSEVLPGGATDSHIGGYAGTGKGLSLTWEFDPETDVSYQDTYIEVDLELHGTQPLGE